MWVCVSLSSDRVGLFATPWTVARQAPLSSPGKNARVGCHSRLQRIFLTRGSPALRADSLLTELPGKPSPSGAHGPNQHLQNLRPRPLSLASVEMHVPRLKPTLTRGCTPYKPAGAPPRKPAQAPHSGSLPGRSDRSPSPLHLAEEVLLSVTSPRFQRLPLQFTRSGYSFTTPILHTQ